MTATIQDIDRHAESVRAGFASMNPPPPRHRGFSTAAAPEDDPPEATAAPESTDDRVWRDAGMTARFDLRFHGVANVEHLTGGLLKKAELNRLGELQTALDRLATEIHAAGLTPINFAKVAMTFPAGDLPPESAVAAVIGGDDARMARKRLAKASARRFFDEQCHPLVVDIYARAAAMLEGAILDRRKIEEEVHEKHAEIFHDEISVAYKPSPGLIRMMARRRQLIDNEIPIVNPPSLRAALSGIVAF